MDDGCGSPPGFEAFRLLSDLSSSSGVYGSSPRLDKLVGILAENGKEAFLYEIRLNYRLDKIQTDSKTVIKSKLCARNESADSIGSKRTRTT